MNNQYFWSPKNGLLLLFNCSVVSNSLWPVTDCSTSGFPVLCLPDFAWTHVHWVNDAIQVPYPLSRSPPALSFSAPGSFPVSQFSTPGGRSIRASASSTVLPTNIQHWYPLWLTGHVRLCDPVDFSPPGSSVHGIFQARVLEWIAISFFRGSSRPRDRTCNFCCVSCIAGRFFPTEPVGKLTILNSLKKLKKMTGMISTECTIKFLWSQIVFHL